ncbi:rabenosyn-5-like [Dermatophagoides pteronyssinus]|uniref:rabenosyn-5-like n=1 Tax=Dermatophagoides pteronyssinus TaxID=6956 RepID=UPI003F67DFE1
MMNPFDDENDYDSTLDPFDANDVDESEKNTNPFDESTNPFDESIAIETPEISNEQYQLIGNGSLQAEGLLCPDCMEEYRTITELMSHFDNDHRQYQQQQQSNSSKNSIGKKNLSKDQIKDFVRKIIIQTNKLSTTTTVQQDNSKISSEINDYRITSPIDSWKYSMSLGMIRSHWNDYHNIRDKQIERYVFETNKLLIRLDRLMQGYSTLLLSSTMDIDNRRRHEQSIVEWLDERSVPLCPSCACKFNIILKKRHHCRLCGAVMCSKCSKFITFKFADELLKPFGFNGSSSANDHHHHPNNNTSPSISMLKLRTILAKSINYDDDDNNLDLENSIESIRICNDCYRLLILRRDKFQRSHYQCPLIEIYTKLRESIQQLDQLLSIYDRMADSLNLGETTYQLQDAIDVKNKLTKLGEEIDFISRKIETYDESTDTLSQQQRQKSIQTLIRRSTIHYLRENLLSLNELPDSEHYEQLKQSHNEMIERRIQYEKQMALYEQEQYKKQQEKIIEKTIVGNDGFCPQQINLINEKGVNRNGDNNKQFDDPILQQMAIIQSYIEQARKDNRYEEMRLLESNLKELEIEYFFVQQQQNSEKLSSQRPSSSSSVSLSLNPFGDLDD